MPTYGAPVHTSERAKITHYRCDMQIDAAPDDVFRLVTEIEQWQALFPHVQSVRSLEQNCWHVTMVWRALPFNLTAGQRVSLSGRSAEQRFAAGMGMRFACRWAVSELPEDSTRLSLDVEFVQGPAMITVLLLRSVVPDLVRETLEMISLLAESDRKAHQEIV
jgi:ribosome-associated toxin RatA of RatAB toxin-antitoxin module